MTYEPVRSAIPQPFLDTMSRLLGDEYLEFLDSFAKPANVGLRINSIKSSLGEFIMNLPFILRQVPWCPTGFTLEMEHGNPTKLHPGKHVFHAAGLYYLQEPSAMVAAELLSPQPGEKVLDLAAAPGGKTTHLAALMNNSGLLVANEIHPRRVWDLAENLERLGVTNSIVLNESPNKLAEHFGEYFDRILLDAPCSGEGMFRKSEIARQEWKPGLPKSCALRQISILEQAAKMLKPGGQLVYTTCTFSPVENEAVIAQFLDHHSDFILETVREVTGVEHGKPEWINLPPDHQISKAIRIWPHHSFGEGHFAALLTKKGHPHSQSNQRIRKNAVLHETKKYASKIKANMSQVNAFLQENLSTQIDVDNLIFEGNYVYLQPSKMPELYNLRVIHPGWWLGSIHADRFIPSHSLAMGISAEEARNVVRLPINDERISRYLAGDIIHSDGQNGWVLIAVDRFPIGWGKRVNQIIKNFYPKGLRN